MPADYIPNAIPAFNQWQHSFMELCAALPMKELNIPEEEFQKVALKSSLFEAAHAKAENPATRTSINIYARDAALKELEAAIRQFVNAYIRYNPKLSDSERKMLGVKSASHEHHPVPVPDSYPKSIVDHSIIRRLRFDYHDAGSTSKAKPAGVLGAELKWMMAEQKPKSILELIHSEFGTHTPFLLEFDEEDRGATVWYALRWENTRGEKGPFGEIQSAVVP